MNIRIEPGTQQHLAEVARIQAAAPEAAQWDPASYLEHEFLVALSETEIVGFLVARAVAGAEREILNLAIDPAWRRRGIGRQLLASEIARGGGAWYLEVRESNSVARLFYERLGFAVAGRRPAYYNVPAESAIVMRFES